MSDFNLELAKSLSNSSEQYPVSLDDAWQWIGYTRKDSAVDTLRSYFDEGVDYILRLQPESDNHAGLSAQEKAAAARTENLVMSV